MLKQRLITASILIPLVVWALLGLDSVSITVLLTVVGLLAAWEWLQLIGIQSTGNKAFLCGLLLVLGGLSLTFLPVMVILSVSVAIWFFATLLVLVFAHKPLSTSLQALFRSPLFGFLAMTLILIGFVSAASLLHSHGTLGPLLVLFVLVTVWLADTGGYFAGKRFGKHKLATAISPNKTWEGVAGAQVMALTWAAGFYFLVEGLSLNLAAWLGLTAFIVMISIVGDLLESVFKRCFDVKDSGQLLPGHGGMLDRIDSLLAAVPVFTASLFVLGA